MKLDNELRIYDVQNNCANGGEVTTHYHDINNVMFQSDGYRYFVDGLLDRLNMSTDQLRHMPSPTLELQVWEMIDYCGESGAPLEGDTRGACLLWLDAVLNAHWPKLLDEAYPN